MSHSGPAADLLRRLTAVGVHFEAHFQQLWLIGDLEQLESLANQPGALEGLLLLAAPVYEMVYATTHAPIDVVH